MNNMLFKGGPSIFGGLSNEMELQKECPEEFKKHWYSNKWCKAASKLFFNGGSISHWVWKTTDENIINHQLECFKALLTGFELSHEDKEAIAGWMLSEMLTEVPKHVPSK